MKIILEQGIRQAKIQKIQLLDILGTGTEYIWEEIEKNPNIAVEETIETLTYNLSDMTEIKDDVINSSWKFNWSELYGELGERRV